MRKILSMMFSLVIASIIGTTAIYAKNRIFNEVRIFTGLYKPSKKLSSIKKYTSNCKNIFYCPFENIKGGY